MSLERAYKNCMACYYDSRKRAEPMEILVQNEGVRYFMNNAMMALETVTTSPWASGSGQDEATLAQEALEACVSCNFSKAYIAEIVKKAVFTKK